MKIGIIPTIKHEAAIFQRAYLRGDDESKVQMEIPERTPMPVKPIIRRTSHQGTPSFSEVKGCVRLELC